VSNMVGGPGEEGAWQDFVSFSITEPTVLKSTFFSYSFLTGDAVDNFLVQLTKVGESGFYLDSSALSQVESFSFTLDAGDYEFNLSGSGNDGVTAGLYTVGISAVPEAPIYAMMLGGLGVISLVARKRNN